ncbi:hypothetical protein TSMEX_000773 [Taenia solium]|eukprot:TsM_000531500 transcript=TsM_000531500 gene=TsM_000531500
MARDDTHHVDKHRETRTIQRFIEVFIPCTSYKIIKAILAPVGMNLPQQMRYFRHHQGHISIVK